MATVTAENGASANAAASDDGLVRRAVSGNVLELTLTRAKARNALSLDMMAALKAAVDDASADPDIRAVVLCADGPAFCAGHDLKELTSHRADSDGGRAFYALTMQRCSELMQAIVTSPKPFIAAIEATATAAGCQLVSTCDLAVASETAKFCTPGVNIGLFCSTPMVALSRNVPRKRAMEMLLLGELISASEAAQYGLVNRVVAPGAARDGAMELAQRIAEKSSVTVAIGKRAFYDQIEKPLGEAYDFAAEVMTRNMMERDAAEGIVAFVEKRHPVWTHQGSDESN